MSKKPKIKAAAQPAAQTRAEAEAFVARIGEIQRELQRQDANLGDSLATLKIAAEELALPLAEEMARLQDRVQGYFEANRAELTRQGRTKTVKLTTGKVFWRDRPESVSLRGVDAIIEHLQTKLAGKFLRTKVEISKEAMLDAKEEARQVPGVTIKSAGEEFVIEPFEAQLAAVA